MKILFRLVLIALVLLGLPYIIPGISVGGFYAALFTALLLGVLNVLIKPIVSLVTLPVNVLTLGLFGLVINALFLWFVASLVDGFVVDSFVSAFLGALVLSAVNWVLSKF